MIDAHCHLQEFEDIQAIVSSAGKAGIAGMICCGADLESSKKAIEIAEKFEQVYATVGCHPDQIFNFKFLISSPLSRFANNQFLKLAKSKKVVAIGECGLDFLPETRKEEKSAQRELLKFNIDLAKKARLPLVVHCRNAFADIFEIVDYDKVQMHCFTGNMEQMQECVRRGWYISFGGIVTFKSSQELREVAKAVPEDKLLVETDAPYLAPEPVRGSRNMPTNVKIVAAKIAEVRGTSINQIEEVTTENARLFFGLR